MTQSQRKATYGFTGPTAVAIREKLGQGLALAALGVGSGVHGGAYALPAVVMAVTLLTRAGTLR